MNKLMINLVSAAVIGVAAANTPVHATEGEGGGSCVMQIEICTSSGFCPLNIVSKCQEFRPFCVVAESSVCGVDSYDCGFLPDGVTPAAELRCDYSEPT